MVLIVYVDDILLSGSNVTGIEETKKFLEQQFVTRGIFLVLRLLMVNKL